MKSRSSNPTLICPGWRIWSVEMIKDSLDSFIRSDFADGGKVRQTEQVVDDLNEQIFREILTFMMEDSKSIHRGLLIMQVSKNMERIHRSRQRHCGYGCLYGDRSLCPSSNLWHKWIRSRRETQPFLKIFFSYLVIICFHFLCWIFLSRMKCAKWWRVRELLTYVELIDLQFRAGNVWSVETDCEHIRFAGDVLVSGAGSLPIRKKTLPNWKNHFNRPEIQEARLRGKGKSTRFSQSLGVDMLYVAVPIKK